MSNDERDTLRPKPEPIRVPVSKLALQARRPLNADVPVPPEEEFQARMSVVPALPQAPPPSPPVAPITVDVQRLPSLWPTVGRWLAPRALLMLGAAFGGGAAAPRLTGSTASQESIRALSDKLIEQQRQLDAQDVELAAQKKLARQQTAFWVELWAARGNIEIGFPENVPTRDFNIGDLQIDAPKDPKKPAVLKFPAVPVR